MKSQLLIFFNGLIMKVIMEEISLHGDFDNEDRTEENEDNTTDSQANEDEVDVHPPRKLLTKKRLVHDIDSALDKYNYGDLHLVNGEEKWETLTSYLGPKKDKNTKAIVWTGNFSLCKIDSKPEMRFLMEIIHSHFWIEQETLSLLKVHLFCSSAMKCLIFWFVKQLLQSAESILCHYHTSLLTHFQPMFHFPYPLKTSENLFDLVFWFFHGV